MNHFYFTTKSSKQPSGKGDLGLNHKGFTLIETLFSILIFSAALISLMTIAGRGISATGDAAQETTAHYLAQEGLEVVRNLRDTNFLTPSLPWDTGFAQCNTTTNACNVVYDATLAPTVTGCGLSKCPLYQNVQGEFVNQSSGALSQYTRSIMVTPITSNTGASLPDPSSGTTSINNVNEYQVVSTVYWTSKGIPHVVSLETLLKDW